MELVFYEGMLGVVDVLTLSPLTGYLLLIPTLIHLPDTLETLRVSAAMPRSLLLLVHLMIFFRMVMSRVSVLLARPGCLV